MIAINFARTDLAAEPGLAGASAVGARDKATIEQPRQSTSAAGVEVADELAYPVRCKNSLRDKWLMIP